MSLNNLQTLIFKSEDYKQKRKLVKKDSQHQDNIKELDKNFAQEVAFANISIYELTFFLMKYGIDDDLYKEHYNDDGEVVVSIWDHFHPINSLEEQIFSILGKESQREVNLIRNSLKANQVRKNDFFFFRKACENSNKSKMQLIKEWIKEH